MANTGLAKTVLTLASVALTIWILQQVWSLGSALSGILSILAGAWFLTVLVRPMIFTLTNGILPGFALKRLGGAAQRATATQLRLPFGLAVGISYLALFMFVLGIISISATSILPELTDLVKRSPEIYAQLPQQLNALWDGIARQLGLDVGLLNRVVSSGDIAAQVQAAAGTIASQTVRIATGTASVLGQILLAFVLSLYISTEGRILMRDLFRLLPSTAHQNTMTTLRAFSNAFDGYLRGAILAAAIEALNATIWMTLLGVNFAFALGAFYFVMALVPLIGAPVSLMTIAIVTLIFTPAMLPWILLALIVFNLISAYVITPRLMKDAVGLPSLLGLVATSAGVTVFGFWGLLFGVPVAGALYELLFKFLGRREPALAEPQTELAPSKPGNSAKSLRM